MDFFCVSRFTIGTASAMSVGDMDNILVAVFEHESNAREASRALEALADADTIRLNAGAIVSRTAGGGVTVIQAHRQAPEATLGATAIGVLVGMLAGPVGLAIGAATGLVAGGATDMFNLKVERDFLGDVERSLEPGKTALAAQIYEEETDPVNERMAALGGVVFRRELTEVTDEE
jgi:uncharacterized membrane protein